MGQPGFFDLDKRLETISAKGDPLEVLNFIVPFENFRADIEAVVRPSAEERKSNAGRKPFDAESKPARRPRVGMRSRPRMRRKIKTHAGRRRTRKTSTATRTTSASTASTRSFGATRRPTPLFTTAGSLMRFWTSPTPAMRCGPTAPTGRQKLKRSSRKRATRAAFIAAAPATTLYLSGKRPPTPRAHECALVSNTYLRIRKTGWAAYLCVPLGWRVRP